MNKRMFRKILAGGLILGLSLGLGLTASCEEPIVIIEDIQREESFPYAGVTLEFPEEFEKAFEDGKIKFEEGEIEKGIHYLYVRYVDNATKFLANVFAIDDTLSPYDVILALSDYLDGDDSLTEDMFTEIGREGGTVYYSVEQIKSEDEEGSLPKASKKEYKALLPLMEGVLAGATYTTPKVLFEGLVGSTLEFETTDLDGNPVNSKDLFAQHAYTMVNVWALASNSALGELPSLAIMNDKYAEQDCAIVGLLADENEDLEEIKSLLSACRVSYVNLMPWKGAFDVLDTHAGLPISFFVDRDGVVVADPVAGAELDVFENTFNTLIGK